MYCNFCGKQIQDDAVHCAYCGRTVGYVAAHPLKLIRPPKGSPDRKVAGVCAGFAQYFDLDVTLVRVVWLILAIFGGGAGVVAYVIAWIVMPEAPEVFIQQPAPMVQPYQQ
jgi:phage shock protein C